MEFLFLGLGNPEEYRGTRHNIGKDFVEGLAHQAGCEWKKIEKTRITPLSLGSREVVCAVSDGYMNSTGEDMREILGEINPEKMLVIHDEMDIPVGKVILSRDKSPGGHKGVASVAREVGATFTRLRIGVGRGEDTKKYVLDRVPPEEMERIARALREALPDIMSQVLKRDGESPETA